MNWQNNFMNMFAHRILTTALLLLGVTSFAQAQDIRDSVIYRQSAAMDSTLDRKSVV